MGGSCSLISLFGVLVCYAMYTVSHDYIAKSVNKYALGSAYPYGKSVDIHVHIYRLTVNMYRCTMYDSTYCACVGLCSLHTPYNYSHTYPVLQIQFYGGRCQACCPVSCAMSTPPHIQRPHIIIYTYLGYT